MIATRGTTSQNATAAAFMDTDSMKTSDSVSQQVRKQHYSCFRLSKLIFFTINRYVFVSDFQIRSLADRF